MRKHPWLSVTLVLAAITALFFYQTVLYGKVPFPADSLVSYFQPWRSFGYEGYAPGGIPNKAQYPDTVRQIYPWKTQVITSLKQGKLPLWNPYNFSGAPLLANFQSAALYPPSFLYLIFSQIDAWTILVILQPTLAALFTYLYSRKLGMGNAGSWLSAISYGFSGFMAVWLEYNTVGHVILWLPLILLAVEHLRGKPHAVWLAVLAFSHTSALLAGHPQVYAYLLAFSLLYSFFRASGRMRLYCGIFTFLGIGIAGLQIVPGLELIGYAARSPHDPDNLFSKILIQPWQLLTLPFPNLFGNPATRTYFPDDTFVGKVTTIGLVPLFFILSALRRKDSVTKWFVLSCGIILLLVTAHPVTYLLYRIPIPVITSSSPTLMTFLLAFALSVTSGLGLDHWIRDTHSVRKLVRRTVEVLFVFGLLVSAVKSPVIPWLSGHEPVVLRAILYGALVAGATLVLFWVAIRLPKLRTHAIFLLLILHVFDLFVFFNRFNPFVPKSLVFPEHAILSYLRNKAPDRYWGYGTANVAANFATQYGLFSPEGYDPLYPKWYGEFLYSYRDGKPLTSFDTATRSDAAIASGFGDGGLSDINKQKVLNSLSVRFILDRIENSGNADMFPPEIFRKDFAFEDWIVYENMNASPRIFMDNGAARILSYEPERITIQTESTAPATLILTDTYYPGWTADIDGTKTDVYRMFWARGVTVPPGTHTITMSYAPKSVIYGVVLSVMSLGATIIGLMRIRRVYV